MNVILLQKIHKLGELGETVSVKPGFGRNYLFPKGKAVPATPDNLARFEQQRADLERQQLDAEGAARARADSLQGTVVTIIAKAGPEGKLYGSVGPSDIAEALTRAGTPIERREVRLADGPLRMLGDHAATLQLYAEVAINITVQIKPEVAAPEAG